MSITATTNSQPRELIPAGNYVARCYSMIHIGTVTDEYMGEMKIRNKIRITWELPNETRVFNEEKGEQPMVISKEYTLSMYERSNLRQDLESWRGKGFAEAEAEAFDVTKLLGIPCMINIIHKTSKKGFDYATISSISSLPKGVECPDQVNPTFEWNYTDKYDEKVLEGLPQFIQDDIKRSQEYRDRAGLTEEVEEVEAVEEAPYDDVPLPTNDDLPF